MKRRKIKENPTAERPLIPLAVIVVLTIITVVVAIIILNNSGFFMSVEEKTAGHFSRERIGNYSKEVFLEQYFFNTDGTGKKLCTDADGYTTTDEFEWFITKKNTLVIDGYLKYSWNPKYNEYYDATSKSTKNYWYVDKDGLHIGHSTAVITEHYERNEK